MRVVCKDEMCVSVRPYSSGLWRAVRPRAVRVMWMSGSRIADVPDVRMRVLPWVVGAP